MLSARRMFGWIVASVIVALGLSGLPVLSTATVPLASAAPASDITERPDSVSASVAARVLGHRIEDLSQRTETTQVFANPDGSWTSESAAGPVRARDDTGEWADIDLTLEPVPGGYAPVNAIDDLVISDGGDATFAQMSVDGKDLAWKWPDGPLPAPTVEGNTATYADVVDGGDLVVTATPSGFSHDIVLREAPADPLSFQIPIVTGGPVITKQADGDLTVTTKGGNELVSAPQPVMYDAPDPETGHSEHQVELDATVAKTATGAVVTLDPAESFLNDPTTTYPVTVDPTWNSTNPDDTWIYDTSPTAVHPGDATLYAGTPNGGTDRYRTLVTFNGGGAWAGQAVSSATLTLKNFYSVNADCVGAAVEVRRITTSWTPGSANWNNQPSTTTTGAVTNAQAKGNSGCPAGDVSWPVTSIVQTWAAGTANYGFRVAGLDETKSATYRKYRSAGYTYASSWPRLAVTYNSYPGTPTTISVSPFQNALVNSTTPTLSAKVSDPDLGYVYAKYAIYSGANLVWSDYGSKVTSGGTSTKPVPAGKLTNGTAYTLRTYGWDGALTSKSYVSTSFTVDTTAPSVTVTSDKYTDGQWLVTPPTSNTFTLNGDSDVASFKVEEDGVASTLAVNGSGDATVSWNPQSGAHVLKVTPTDKAGNAPTAATSFSFGAGPAEFNQPTVAERSTSAFPVNIAGPPNATGASLSWRVAGTTTWNPATSVTKSGAAWDGSVSAAGSGSTSGDLVWKATAETDPATNADLIAPALVEVRACFTYSGSGNVCTDPRQVQLVATAFGGHFPVATVGPAQVALFTGEITLSTADAADSTAGLGRSFTSYDDATTTPGVFGPGWSDAPILAASSAASATVVDNRATDGTFIIIDASGGSQTFVTAGSSTTSFVPLEPTGDATALDYAPGPPATLVLTRPLGSGSVKTSWTLTASDNGGDPAWVLDAANAPGTDTDTTVVSDAQRPVWVRESAPNSAATCTKETQTQGCRGLTITYTGTGTDIRVASVARLIGASDQNDVATKTLATYTYDASGRLAEACGPKPSANQPSLCTSYEYATVDGRTVITKMTPAGSKPWRFEYTASGKLQTVKREKPTGGDATWSVNYDLTVSSSGLPDMGSAATREWGQDIAPTRVFAVTSPTTGTPDITNSMLYYTREDGTTTNTAAYGPSGWLVGTQWYGDNGNVIQTLDPTGWARVQAEPAAARPAEADNASSYTVYNTWGDADTIGTRVVDRYGPAHTATLEDGTTGLFRTHTHTVYDDDPNVDPALIASRPAPSGTDPAGLGLAVKTTTSAADPTRTSDSDTHVTIYGYAPVVSGDGNGWTLGTPTSVATKVDANTWSTQITRYDADGREIESRQPGGAADASGAGSDAHSTVTSYYTAGGSGDCGLKPAWAGLVCKVSPAGQPSGPAMPVTYTTNYNDDLKPTSVEELSGPDPQHMAVTRTTTSTYDALGRATAVTRATSGQDVTQETVATSYSYDDAMGLLTTTGAGGQNITTGYDTWGRPTTYSDVSGTSSSTTYDAAGDVASLNDGTGTYTYTYDQHGVLDSVDAGGGVGSFGYHYTTDGLVDQVTYPNGMVAARSYDEIGTLTALNYTQGSTDIIGFSATTDVEGRTTAQASDASAQQFRFDGLGRLTNVEDKRADGCTTRTYAFDASSDRTNYASYAPAADLTCQTSSPATGRTNTYDSAGRIRNTGYTYDTLGRTLTTPQVDAGPNAASDLTATYHADDMVATLSLNVSNGSGGTDADVMSYGLDPAGRVSSITATANGNETHRLRYGFAGDSDAPATVATSTNGGSSWASTRYVTVPGLGMTASSGSGTTTLQLANLHGDVVATMPDTSGASILSTYAETEEFGVVPAGSTSQRFGWLGSSSRSNDTVGGLVLMGARVFNPTTGAFLQPDPVLNGGLTKYGYPTDPVNVLDPTGQCWGCGLLHKLAKAASYVVQWALINAAQGWLGKYAVKTVFAVGCEGMAVLCQAAVTGFISGTVTLLLDVFKNHKSIKESLGHAAWDGALAFAGVVTGYVPASKLYKLGSKMRGLAYKFSDFLEDMGHSKTALGIVTLTNLVIDNIYDWYL